MALNIYLKRYWIQQKYAILWWFMILVTNVPCLSVVRSALQLIGPVCPVALSVVGFDGSNADFGCFSFTFICLQFVNF